MGISASFIRQMDLKTQSLVVASNLKTQLAESPACEADYIGRGGTQSVCRDMPKRIAHRLNPVPHPLLFLISTSPKVELNMKDRTETLEIGARAPDFSLGAANREGTFTLGGLLAQGTLVLEFLRGTW
jgi:hypothetical protein